MDEAASHIVSDVEAPTFPNGCPADLSVFSGPLESPVSITWTDPVTTDNSGQSVTLTSDLAKGSQLGLGSHTVTLNASDAVGNIGSCNFYVTVQGEVSASVCLMRVLCASSLLQVNLNQCVGG